MTREQFSNARDIISRIDDISKKIAKIEQLSGKQISVNVYMLDDGYYFLPIPASENRVNDFISIVMQDLVLEKARLEKELEDL